jgi:hypothetical protein
MKEDHDSKFNEIQNLLKLKLGDRVICSEEHGTKYLQIKDSEFWMSTEFEELVVGIGLINTHFGENYGNLYDDGIIQAFELLTNKIKTTNFIKGKTIFKTIIEIEYPNSKTVNIGDTSILMSPF